MNTKKNLILGCIMSVFFLWLLFYGIPHGIEVPRTFSPGQINPTFYPIGIASGGLLIAALLIITSLIGLKREQSSSTDAKTFFTRDTLVKYLGVAGMFIAFFLMPFIGLLGSVFCVYLSTAYCLGERNLFRAMSGAACTAAGLFVFFVKIASLPIPMGLLGEYLLDLM